MMIIFDSDEISFKKRVDKTTLSNKIILGLIFFLAALPFGQALSLNLGFVILNAFELIYLAMFFILFLNLFFKIKLNYPICFFLFLGIAIIYSLYSIVAYNIDLLDPVRHLRFYLQFVIALLILATGVQFSIELYMNILVLSSIVSAGSALIIHYFFIDFLWLSFSANEEVADIAMWGRLYWGNSVLVFFVSLCFFIKEFSINKTIITISFFISFIALFSTLSRTMLMGMLLFLLISVNFSENLNTRFKRYLIGFVVVMLVFLVVQIMMDLDPRIESLFNSRFIGISSSSNSMAWSSIYEEAVENDRLFLYEQYIDNITGHLFLGQGLGIPVAVTAKNIPIFVTDISLFSFVIPFGIFGLILFFSFVGQLFFLVNRIKYTLSMESKKIILSMLIILLIFSFNFDVFSRNNFVIFYTTLVVLLDRKEKMRNHRKKIFSPV